MEIVCWRRWGQPKIKKPKGLNNKTLLGSVRYCGGDAPCKCKVWLNEGSIFVLHRNWFSKSIYFRDLKDCHRPRKFIYDDNFGGVILRNEAIIRFDAPATPIYKFPSNYAKWFLTTRRELTKEFAKMIGIEDPFRLYGYLRWEDFFGEILKLYAEKTKGEEE